MEKLTILIPERMNGQRLDSSLAEMLPNISRSKITSVIKTGDALNNGQKFKPKDKANGNELICLVLNFRVTFGNFAESSGLVRLNKA